MGKLLRVFLCHSSQDKPKVRKLYKQLLADGVDAWLDEEKLIPGQTWQLEIPKAVKNSDIVIVCLSKNSINKDGYIQKEIRLALDTANEKPEGTIFLIPVKLEECEVPDSLKSLHWVNLFGEKGYQKLLQALEMRSREIGFEIVFAGNPIESLAHKPSANREKEDVQNTTVELAAKWIFFGFFGVILMGFLLGANLKDATWLSPGIVAAESNRINIETAHQQAVSDLQERLAQAQTEAEIQQIQREQELLDAKYEHDKQAYAQDLENKKAAFEMYINIIRYIGIAIAFAIVIGTTLWGVSKILGVTRRRPL